MRIRVDADACPVVIKEILYRAAVRAQIPLTLVADKMLRVPPSPWIKALQVPGGFSNATGADRQAFANQLDRLLTKRRSG